MRMQKTENEDVRDNDRRGYDTPHQRFMQNACDIEKPVLQHAIPHDRKRNKHKITRGIQVDAVHRRNIQQRKHADYRNREQHVIQFSPHDLVRFHTNSNRVRDNPVRNADNAIEPEQFESDASPRNMTPVILVKTRQIVTCRGKRGKNSAYNKKGYFERPPADIQYVVKKKHGNRNNKDIKKMKCSLYYHDGRHVSHKIMQNEHRREHR